MVRRVVLAAVFAALGVAASATADIRVLDPAGAVVAVPVRDRRTQLWRWTDDATGLLVARGRRALRVSIADGAVSPVPALDGATSVGPGGRSGVVHDYPTQVSVRAPDGTVVASARPTDPDLTEVSEVAWSPDGRRAAFVVDEKVSVVDADSGAAIATLAAPGIYAGDLSEQAFSPDGKALVAGNDDWVIKIDVATGTSTALAELPRGYWDAPTWGSNGAIAVTGEDRIVLLGDPVPEIRSVHAHSAALWAPDGSRLTYVQSDYPGRCGDAQASVRTIVPGSAPQTLLATPARIRAWAWSPDSRRVAVGLDRDPNTRGKRHRWPRQISRRFEMLTRAGDAAVRRVFVRAVTGLRQGAGRAKTLQRLRLGLDRIGRRHDEAQDTAVQEHVVVELNRWLRAAGFAGLDATDELDC